MSTTVKAESPTFYDPFDEGLCLSLIDFFDTNTEEKRRKYLNFQGEDMLLRMHARWMTENGEKDGYKINRFKRMCQLVELAWIEAKFPDLYKHLELGAEYYQAKFNGENPDPGKSIRDHWAHCDFCKNGVAV
jgi:hypothetical protein